MSSNPIMTPLQQPSSHHTHLLNTRNGIHRELLKGTLQFLVVSCLGVVDNLLLSSGSSLVKHNLHKTLTHFVDNLTHGFRHSLKHKNILGLPNINKKSGSVVLFKWTRNRFAKCDSEPGCLKSTKRVLLVLYTVKIWCS